MSVLQAVIDVDSGVDPLKPERVQEPLADEAEVRLKAAEKLRTAAAWRIVKGGKAAERSQRFPSEAAAVLYSSFVTSLASSLRVPVGVRMVGPQVFLSITGRKVQGRRAFLSEGQLDFAAMLA